MTITDRKNKILEVIIREHIATGAPVGSSILVNKYDLQISSATVRNEMAELEEGGYIVQPHTSAGRIPTEKAYMLFLENLKNKTISKKEEEELAKALTKINEPSLKQVSKVLSTFSNNAVFWAFHKNSLYYTGLSNLFSQPEFFQPDLIHDISSVIDRMDEVIDKFFDQISEGVNVYIGSQNPFSSSCSSVLVKYKKNNQSGLFGILGPMRMDYERNIALVKFIHDKLKSN